MKEADKQMLADHYLDFYRIAFSMLRNEADTEDAVQEALVVTMTRHLWGDPYNYCVTVLRNICIKMKKRNVEVLLDNMLEVPNPDPGVDSQRLQLLMDLMEAMPEREREVLNLYYEKGYTKADIAKMKGVSVSLVKKLFTRGLDMLRKQFIEIDKNNKDIFKP